MRSKNTNDGSSGHLPEPKNERLDELKNEMNTSDSISRILFFSLWAFLCVYIMTYNNSASTANIIALGSSTLFSGLIFFTALFCPRYASRLILVIGALVTISVVLSISGVGGDNGALVRYCISLSALSVFSFAKVGDCRGYLAAGGALLIMYAASVALTAGPLSYSGVVRFTPYFAGETAVHSSSLTMVALVIILWCAPWPMKARLPLCVIGIVLIAGYGVTTALLMLGIFFSARLFEHFRISLKWVGVVALVLLPLGAAWRDSTQVVGGDVASLGIGSLGSGRLAAWIERIQIFVSSDFLTKVLGTGAYSDYRTTSLWWWSEKGAHSDAVTILMEFGLLGVVVLLGYLVFLFGHLTTTGRAALLTIVVGMVLSNVLLDRPTVAMVWGVALYSASRRGSLIGSAQQKSAFYQAGIKPATRGQRLYQAQQAAATERHY